MRSMGIAGTGSYVPPKVVTNFDLKRFLDTSEEWITTKTGITQRRFLEGDVCTSNLAVKVSEGPRLGSRRHETRRVG